MRTIDYDEADKQKPIGNFCCRLCGDLIPGPKYAAYCYKYKKIVDLRKQGPKLDCYSAFPSDVPDDKIWEILLTKE